MGQVLVRFCPQCKSKNVSSDLSKDAYGSGGFFNKYTCDECGFSGQFFPVMD